MRSATWRTLGTVGLGLVAVFLVLGMSGATVLFSGPAAPARGASTDLIAGHSALPAVSPPLATWVSTAGATGPTTISVLPAWVNFTISYGNVNHTVSLYNTIISAANASVTLTIYNESSGAYYMTYAVPLVTNTTSYSIMLDSAFLGCSAPDCTVTMPSTYEFSLWSTLNGAVAGGTAATNATTNFAATSWVTTLPTWVNTITYNGGAASGPSGYTTLPAYVDFSIMYGNVGPSFTISATNTVIGLEVLNERTLQAANFSVPIVTGQSTYSVELTTSGIVGATPANCPTCAAVLGTMNDTYSFFLWPSLNGAANRGTLAINGTGSKNVPQPLSTATFLLTTPSFTVTAPAATVTTGNITVTVNYTASRLVSLVFSAWTPATLEGASPVLVFSASFLKPANSTAPVSKIWFEGTPGSYSVSLGAYLAYGSVFTNGTVTVVSATTPGGGIIYQNSTVYNNATGASSPAGYFGLNPAVSGTTFLLVGLIVGILAGLVAARMIMSSGPAKPAQPWSEKKEETSNTCSVCGKSFGSADELAAHAKSEHGMQ